MSASAANELTEPRRSLLESIRAATLETKLAEVGLLCVGIHVLDDSFLQPQPGTSGADHLVSGLVPLAILAAAGIFYPRIRAGFRATIALILGLLGVVIGLSEPVYYATHGGISGDDYTGFLAAAGGFLLLGVGAVTLWRTRRRDDRPAWRYTRRLLLGLLAFVIVSFVLFPFSLSYGFTHAARAPTESGDLGAPYQPVSFKTNDGLELEGWYVPSRNGAAVIVFPGKKGTQSHARMLVRRGYGVLVFDRRGEGDSDGDPNALGWAFNRDLKGALGFMRGRGDVEGGRIGALGLSVGGEALLQAAAEAPGFKAVVSEGAGVRSVREEVIHTGLSRLPEIVATGIMTAGTALFSNQLPPPSLESLTPRIAPTPAFFIYATKGQGGESNTVDYYEAAGAPKRIWKTDSTHTHGLSAQPEEYERRVVGFFDESLLGG
jgi:uncharacterized protein